MEVQFVLNKKQVKVDVGPDAVLPALGMALI